VQPLWISHRGYHAEAAENSAAAFRAALARGFTALETDLRMSRDGHVVLCHDPALDRVAGDPRLIAALTREQLAAVRLRDGSPLVFLDEFLRDYGAASWTFDVKRETGSATLRALKELTDASGSTASMVARTRFVLWSGEHETLCRDLFPGASFYARERQCWRAGLAVLAGVPFLGGIRRELTYALPPRIGSRDLFLPAIVQAYRTRGARVVAYLPETDALALAAVKAGVDEVLTNGLPVRL
jgi:glycerophosphoryl diester phosphodiesterase